MKRLHNIFQEESAALSVRVFSEMMSQLVVVPQQGLLGVKSGYFVFLQVLENEPL